MGAKEAESSGEREGECWDDQGGVAAAAVRGGLLGLVPGERGVERLGVFGAEAGTALWEEEGWRGMLAVGGGSMRCLPAWGPVDGSLFSEEEGLRGFVEGDFCFGRAGGPPYLSRSCWVVS